MSNPIRNNRGRFRTLTVLVLLVLGAVCIHAEEFVYPPDAGVINIRDHGARGDGVTDDTKAFRKAIAAGCHNSRYNLIYIPDGAYLISDMLEIKNAKGGWGTFVNIQGQSRKGTIIKLKDNCKGFQDPKNPRWMIRTKEGNMAFRFRFSHFTLNTGKGNPGACGIFYISCNKGSLRHVSVVSSDPSGAGVCGIDSDGENAGLSLVKHCSVTGFDIGMRISSLYPGMAFEHVELTGQRKIGFHVRSNCAVIRKLRSNNAVPALVVGGSAQAVLSQSVLSGGSADAAIINEGQLLVRDTTVEGYASSIKEKRKGPNKTVNDKSIDEYASRDPASLFPSTGRSLNLDVPETPEVPWDAGDNFARWQNVKAFGAVPDDKKDDTDAIQRAFDAARESGKHTVYFPGGIYNVSRTLVLKGGVRRLLGMPSAIEAMHKNKAWPHHGYFEGNSEPIILRVEAGSPVVVIDRLHVQGTLEHAAPNDLFLRLGGSPMYRNTVTGGRALLEDYDASYDIKGPQEVYARLWNPTWGSANYPFYKHNPDDPAYARNDGGTFWVMGMDHEAGGTRHVMLRNLNGASAEIVGILDWKNKSHSRLFENIDSRLSVAALRSHTGVNVTDTRNGWRRDEHLGKQLLIVADSPEDKSPPAAVSGLTAQPTGEAWPFTVRLEWKPASDPDTGIAGYEVRRNGETVGFTQEHAFTDSPMKDDFAVNYDVIALNGALMKSNPVQATTRTPVDPVKLAVQEAYATADPPRVHLLFSKPVDKPTATALSSYSVEGAQLTAAALEEDGRTVTLTLDKLSPAAKVTVKANGVRDQAQASNTLSNTKVQAIARGDGNGLLAVYFADAELKGEPVVTRPVPNVNWNWHRSAPVPELPADGFGMRITGKLRPRFSEKYTFIIESADGVRMWIDNQKIFDTWTESKSFGDSYGAEANWRRVEPIMLTAGKLHDFRIEFREWKYDARLILRWHSESQDREVVPVSAFFLTDPKQAAIADKAATARHRSLGNGDGVLGTYHFHPYKKRGLKKHTDSNLALDFGKDAPKPLKGKTNPKHYKIEWSGWIRANKSGWHTFGIDIGQKDKVELFVDGYRMLEARTGWGKGETQPQRGDRIFMREGEAVPLYLFFRQSGRNAKVVLWWEAPGQKREVVPQRCLYSKPPTKP